jgi:hypothetical protein
MTTTERASWPAGSDVVAWADLANVAMQLESLQIDEAENRDWEALVSELVARRLPYRAYIEERQAALDDRLRRRKREQANLRYKYGFRPGDRPRNPRLIRVDVKRFLRFREL